MKWTDTTLFLCLLLVAGCLDDAERRNPLDPKSDNFDNTGSVSGRVLTYYSPFAPIANAEIRLEPGPFLAISNSSGNFELENINPGRYKISAEKSGYAAYADSIEISTQQSTNIDLNLDALPVVSGFTVATGRISRWFPSNDLLTLEVTAEVSDPDGMNDIDRVEFIVPQLNIREPLNEIASGQFSKRYFENDLPQKNIFDLMGYELQIVATDNAGYASAPVTGQIVRIINELPVAVSPVGREEPAEIPPRLIWQNIVIPFQFTFRIDLFRDNSGFPTAIENHLNIPGEQTTTQINASLDPGLYFWTITIVDAFGNTSRSKENAFEIN